ncbi:coiled-coil domain-containing protein 148-like [Ptychodera flava]|uniref:coiled-coil domain-containing protein 148-like n=1 Tax=Ptychodera flava TaxID=63121 RepID=UPI00396A4105
MTGRDYKEFLSLHRSGRREIARTDDQDNLVIRMREGIGVTKYKPMDYEKLKAIAFEKKFAANQSLMKIEKLAHASKQGKEQNLLKQHKVVWQKEHSRLEAARRRAEKELQVYMQDGTLEESSISTFMLEAEEVDMQLAADEKKFKAATLDPIANLKEDLEVWLREHKEALKAGEEEEVYEEYDRVHKTVSSVKSQQDAILDRLHGEQTDLEEELDGRTLQDLFTVHEKWVLDGIPDEAEELECPDAYLKESVLCEFLYLDERFRERLSEWDARHQSAISSQTGEWDPNDHLVFQAILDQYPHDMANRRMLYIDRMKRQLPHKTRAELVAHEEWYTGKKYYDEHRKVLINSWIRSRAELLNRAKAVFADACLAAELERVAAINRKRQKEICDNLYEKVQQWREQKMEELRLQAEIEAQRQEERNEELRRQAEKERKRRDLQKRKIGEYQHQVEEAKMAKAESDRKRLQELQKQLAEQALIDKERVEFREKLTQEKLRAREEELERQAEAEREKERRLQALRDQVEVNVDYDPYRVMQPTKASKAKLGIGVEEDINIQRPLFEMTGFTSNQVISDPRHKLEAALRSARLQNNPYARSMIAAMKPLKPPRRDMESTIFKMDNN